MSHSSNTHITINWTNSDVTKSTLFYPGYVRSILSLVQTPQPRDELCWIFSYERFSEAGTRKSSFILITRTKFYLKLDCDKKHGEAGFRVGRKRTIQAQFEHLLICSVPLINVTKH